MLETIGINIEESYMILSYPLNLKDFMKVKYIFFLKSQELKIMFMTHF